MGPHIANPQQGPVRPAGFVDLAAEAVQEALTAAAAEHDQLGAAGTEEISKNQFGESAVKLDWEAEEAVIEVLRTSGLPLQIVAEEHGLVKLVPQPALTAVLDGLDGSLVFKQSRGTGRYCTMLAILQGAEPTYGDYLCGGIAQHSPEKRLLLGIKGAGTFFLKNGQRETVSPVEGRTVNDPLRIASYFPALNSLGLSSEQIRTIQYELVTSLGISFQDIVSGRMDLLVDFTHKQNLEQVIAFGILREAGGDIVTVDGQSVAMQPFFEFGQGDAQPVPLIAFGSRARLRLFEELFLKPD